MDYTPLEPVLDAESGAASQSLVHEGCGTNRIWQGVWEFGDVEKAFREAAYVVHIDRLHFHRFSSTPLENNAIIASWDLKDDHIDFICNNSFPTIGLQLHADTDPTRLPGFDLGIVCTKATQTAEAFAPVARLFDGGAVISAQNGLGSEEILTQHTRGHIIRATTFMSGTRHSDTHVQYESRHRYLTRPVRAHAHAHGRGAPWRRSHRRRWPQGGSARRRPPRAVVQTHLQCFGECRSRAHRAAALPRIRRAEQCFRPRPPDACFDRRGQARGRGPESRCTKTLGR